MNFKKNGIFGRREDGGQREAEYDGYGSPNQVLAVWGSPGSGKTTVAVKLAKYLAGKKKNVILLLCDMTAPMLPCICPPGELECEHSLGSVLAAVRVSESLVKHNLVTHKKYGCLTFLGMLKGENEYTYPPFTASQASELIQCLKGIAPYIIIDCGSYIANDILSAVALMESDAVLRLVNCDLKSISYLSSQLPLLRDNKWDADKQYKVASNVRTDEASDHAEQVLGNVTFRLPHSPELARQTLAGNLLADLSLRDSRGFRKELEAVSRGGVRMLGEKRSQELFGPAMGQAASGNGQRAGTADGRDSQDIRTVEGHIGNKNGRGESERMLDANGGSGKSREKDSDLSVIKEPGKPAEKENFAAPAFPSRSRIPTATVGVTNAQAHAAPMEPPAVLDVEEEDEAVQFQKGGTALRTHDLFFSPQDNARDFSSVLQEVQEYISSKYSTLIMDEGGEDTKAQIKRYITKYVQDYRIAVKGMSGQELVDTIYTEMAEFSFLTRYVFGAGIEEIDINSWKDIEIQYAGGETRKLEERFESPQHAINVVRRMLHTSGMVLDNASPAVLGHLSKNIRIAAMKTPLVDEDIGVAASIRIVNPQSMQASDFVKGGTATGEMLDFLTECVRYGISVCVAGATSSGKTTLMGWLLTTIPDKKRIYTIESGSRELALVREKEGKVSNSVIHTLTRDSENDRQRVDQIALLDMALRFNPDVIVVGEMRGPEANAAQEAARTGVAVITTIHSNSCEATYRRMVSLCKRAVDMSDETLMAYVTEAYPIVAFCKQLENRQRRLMEIMECEIRPDGSRHYRPLFQYEITENRMEEGKFIIEGSHRKVNPISEGLARRLTENGMPGSVLERLKGGVEQ